MDTKTMSPVHPGEVLMEDFLRPLNLSQTRLAAAIAVSPRRINEIVLGKRAITADTSLRLAKFFGCSDRFWMNLQVHYDLESQSDRIAEALQGIIPLASRPLAPGTEPPPISDLTEARS